MKKIKLITFLIFIDYTIQNFKRSLIEVDITRGNLNPLPIAVSAFIQIKKHRCFKKRN